MDISEVSTVEPTTVSEESEFTEVADSESGGEMERTDRSGRPEEHPSRDDNRSSPSGRAKENSSAENTVSHVVRHARAILNKLTPERFEVLSGQMQALPLTTPEHLIAVVREIF